MRKILIAGLLIVHGTVAASAQSADPSATCADYLKLAAQTGPTPKSGDADADKMAADMDKKMADYCKANPTVKASDAMMKVMSQ